MTPLPRTLLASGILVAALLVLNVAWIPKTAAQGSSTPEAGEPAATCETPGEPLADEEFPTGVVREVVLGESPILDELGEPSDTVVASSIVCFDPDTLVEIELLPPDDPTSELPHPYTTTFVVLEGELELDLVAACVPDTAGGTCTGTDGEAHYFTADDPATEQSFGDDWTPLTIGDIVVLSEVTVQYQTPADQHARILASGVYAEIDGGGCQRGCWFP